VDGRKCDCRAPACASDGQPATAGRPDRNLRIGRDDCRHPATERAIPLRRAAGADFPRRFLAGMKAADRFGTHCEQRHRTGDWLVPSYSQRPFGNPLLRSARGIRRRRTGVQLTALIKSFLRRWEKSRMTPPLGRARRDRIEHFRPERAWLAAAARRAGPAVV